MGLPPLPPNPGGGQALNLADEDGGGVGDHQEEERGEVGGHDLAHDLSLHLDCPSDSLSW